MPDDGKSMPILACLQLSFHEVLCILKYNFSPKVYLNINIFQVDNNE